MMSKQHLLLEFADGLKRLAIQRQQEQQMNSRDFMYWLRGHLEATGNSGLTASKVAEINRHLSLAIQTEADTKRLAEDYDRARIAKMLHEAGRDDIAYSMSSRQAPAGC